jgi:enoyl-CoA hydratase
MSNITTEVRGSLLLIGVNRPDKMNAFNAAMLRDFSAAYTRLDDEPELRCGVVFAHGEHFTAGLDLMDVAPYVTAGKPIFPEGGVDPWGIQGRVRQKPVVMATHGRTFTLGIELALASDIRIAAANARFAQIEIKRGIFPFGGGTFRLPEQAGWGNAMRWLLTGDEFGAEEAHRIGLVQEVVPLGQQLDRAIQLAETVAAQAPMGVRGTIASARGYLAEKEAAAALLPVLQELMKSDDAREGLMSFVERRAARFTGR